MEVTRFKFTTVDVTTIFINGTLTLASDPVSGTDLATKNYVDVSFTNYLLKSGGTLTNPISQLADGSLPLDSVRKSQADALAQGGSGITTQQIDDLVQNKALRSNPVFTGPLHISSNSYSQNSLVTKKFVDSLNKDLSGTPGSIPPGTLVEIPTDITPSGYLRANGALLDKTTYSSIYSIIGDQFAKTYTGYGNPHSIQSEFNSAVNNGNLGNFTIDVSAPGNLTGTNYLPVGISNHCVFTNRNYVYLLGGDTNNYDNTATIIRNQILRAPINTDGSIGAWSQVGTYPTPIAGAACVYTKDYVYIISGANYYLNESYVTAVKHCYRAALNSDGSLGAWQQVSSLPQAIGYHRAAVIGNYIYVFGGRVDLTTQASLNTVYRAIINSDGTLGPWTLYGNLPVSWDGGEVVVVNNRVYLLGGRSTLSYTTSPFLYANINSDYSLGTWTSLGNFFLPMTHFAAVATANKVYVFGTLNETYWTNTNYYCNKIYYADVTSDPNLNFVQGTGTIYNNSTTQVWSHYKPLITNSSLYLIGGKQIYAYGDWSELNRVARVSFNGGSNNYINILQLSNTDPNKFYLPDLTYKETLNPNMKYYIKL